MGLNNVLSAGILENIAEEIFAAFIENGFIYEYIYIFFKRLTGFPATQFNVNAFGKRSCSEHLSQVRLLVRKHCF